MTLVPAVAVRVPPVQVVAAFAGVATLSSAGIVSVKAKDVAGTVLLPLSIVNVSLEMPFTGIGFAPKSLVNAGGGFTVSVSLGAALVPSDEVRAPELLRWLPASLLVTSTLTVQLAPAATLPPV